MQQSRSILILKDTNKFSESYIYYLHLKWSLIMLFSVMVNLITYHISLSLITAVSLNEVSYR